MNGGLFEAEADIGVELASFVRERLRALTDKVKSATLFGSAVWGESTLRSDIDIAVSCNPGDLEEVENALEQLADAVQQRFGYPAVTLPGVDVINFESRQRRSVERLLVMPRARGRSGKSRAET